jgi:hypothetical protein
MRRALQPFDQQQLGPCAEVATAGGSSQSRARRGSPGAPAASGRGASALQRLRRLAGFSAMRISSPRGTGPVEAAAAPCPRADSSHRRQSRPPRRGRSGSRLP